MVEPRGQVMHALAPLLLNIPAGQGVQVAEPVRSLKKPAAQGTQADPASALA